MKSDHDYQIRLGRKIASMRIAAGMTQKELSFICNMERAALARLEAGGTNPTITTLDVIATGLKVRVPQLIDLD